MATDEANDRIKGFDGLRALAALMVWLEHRTRIVLCVDSEDRLQM